MAQACSVVVMTYQVSVRVLSVVLDLLMTERWLSLSPTQQNNQWCACCRSFDVIMRSQKRTYVMQSLVFIGDADATPGDIRLSVLDVIDVL